MKEANRRRAKEADAVEEQLKTVALAVAQAQKQLDATEAELKIVEVWFPAAHSRGNHKASLALHRVYVRRTAPAE